MRLFQHFGHKGWETEIYSFDLGFHGKRAGAKEMVLRIYAGDAAEKPNKEFRAMSKLRDLGFPVPKVYLLEEDKSVLDNPFLIMEKVNGKTMAEIAGASPSGKKENLVNLFCKILADLHALDASHFTSDRSLFPDPSAYAEGGPDPLLSGMLETGRRMLAHFGQKEFEEVPDWLERRRGGVRAWQLSPVHLDYHFENVMHGERRWQDFRGRLDQFRRGGLQAGPCLDPPAVQHIRQPGGERRDIGRLRALLGQKGRGPRVLRGRARREEVLRRLRLHEGRAGEAGHEA
ncbi:MAG: phosphotransferase [Candidatus Brockarchaeota archaeon]|nr:phosphotransferase [Candidatus Brockarchaeota archaeon]